MDSFLGFVDWILTLVLWVGIPLSATSTIGHVYFTKVKPDDGEPSITVSAFFKLIIRIFIIAIIAWAAVYLIRDLIPAAGSTIVDGLGF